MSLLGATPVEALLDAVARADLAGVADRLGDDVVLSLPSLRVVVTGRSAVVAAVERALTAFPDLRYTSQARYIATGEVTDEATLTGSRLGPWDGVPGSGRRHRLPARVVLAHDVLQVRRVTLWADAAALLAVVDDAPDRTAALPIVSALRATIPTGDPRVFVGTDREQPPPVPVPPVRSVRPAPVEALNPAAARAAALRAPTPRRVRRLVVTVAVAVMAAPTAAIVGWIGHGTLSTPSGPAAPAASTPAGQGAARAPALRAQTLPSPEPAVTRVGNLFTLNTDLTFDVDSARLTPAAEQGLRRVIAQVHAEGRTGTIRVDGFTDSDGDTVHNLRLSRARARAVADVLRAGLRGRRVTVRAQGYGEARPRAGNDTAAGKAANRRVEITVPGRGQPPSAS